MTYLDNTGTLDVGYDGLARPVELRHLRSDNSLIVGFTHTYDRVSNKLTEGKLHDAANSETYGYDSAYRLTSFTRAVGGQAPLQSQWTLDGAGNADQIDGETRAHGSFNEITQRNGTPLTYDDNGNLTDDGEFLYGWDFNNRLASVTRKADGLLIASYSYDAAGRRMRKVVTNSGSLNGTTDFYLDGWREIEERDGSNTLTQQHVYGNYIDEPLVLDRNLDADGTATGPGDQRLFYHQNTQFSTFALTDITATILEGYLYEAYGRQTVYLPGANSQVDFGGDDVVVVDGASGLANPFLYTGRRLDPETGLIYDRARYLNPEQNRFIGRDPIGIWFDQANFGNAYSFVGNNPVNRVDPSGLGFWNWWEGSWPQAFAQNVLWIGEGFIETGMEFGSVLWDGFRLVFGKMPSMALNAVFGTGVYEPNLISSYANMPDAERWKVTLIVPALGLAAVEAISEARQGNTKPFAKLIGGLGFGYALFRACRLLGRPPLAGILQGHAAPQGFSTVWDASTGRLGLMPSTNAPVLPPGFVRIAGGHADVSRALGGNPGSHWGLAVILRADGTLRVTWRSRTLNRTPGNEVPTALRQQIIRAIEEQTGRKVTSD